LSRNAAARVHSRAATRGRAQALDSQRDSAAAPRALHGTDVLRPLVGAGIARAASA